MGHTIIHLQESTDGKIFLNGEDITFLKGKKLAKTREKNADYFPDPYSSLNPRMMVEDLIKRTLLLVSRRYKEQSGTRRTGHQPGGSCG